MKLGIKIQLLLGILLGMTVFMAAFAVQNGIIGTLEEDIRRRMERGLDQSISLANDWLDAVYANARIAAAGEDLKTAVSSSVVDDVFRALSRLDRNLGIGASGGTISLKTVYMDEVLGVPAGSAEVSRLWHRMGMDGEYLKFFSSGPDAVAIVPVYIEGEARPSASLIIVQPLKQGILTRIAESTGAVAAIFRREGTMAASVPSGTGIRPPDPEKLDISGQDRLPVRLHLHELPYYAGKVDIIGDEGELCGSIVLAYPLAPVYSLADMAIRRMIAVLLVVLILAFVASYVLTRQIVQPVSDLVEASRNLSAGKLDQEIRVGSTDEIGLLSSTFEQMRMELKTMIEELRDRNRELEILNRISNEINRAEDSEKLLHLIIETAVEAVNAEKGSLMELDPDSDDLILKIVYAGGDAWTGIIKGQVELKSGEGIAGLVLKERTPVMTNEPATDTRFKHYMDKSMDSRIRSLICLPLMLGDEPVGVINIVNKREGHFTASDLAFLRAFSSQIGVALHKARLYELAITDGLTRLYVRRYFIARLDEELTRARRYDQEAALVLLDIDHFKKVNDTYGHQAGDSVLQEVSDIIKDELRKDLDLAGRYGGEEFGLILPRTDTKACLVIMERIRMAIASRVIEAPGCKKLKVTVSMGAAIFPGCARERESLIKLADQALYNSKESGRNRSTLANLDKAQQS